MNDQKFYSFIGLIKKSGNLISGYNNCICEIKRDKCKLVVIAEDASDNTKEKFLETCTIKNIPYIIHGCKEELGSGIGKAPTSVLIIKDYNMSKVVRDMFK